MNVRRFASRLGCAFRKASRWPRRPPGPVRPRGHSFLNGSSRLAEETKDRRLADLYLFLRQASLRSASLLYGCSATSFLTSSVRGASANVLWPPNLAGLTLPVSRLRLMNPPTALKAKLYNSWVCPDSIAATGRSRRSSEWPPYPSGNLESDSGPLGIPPIRPSRNML
jgi:hypothetical protein